MRSIRLQLIVYFLGLLVLALGVASLLVFRSAQATLREKEEATAALAKARYEMLEVEERNRFDDDLYREAAWLMNRVKVDFDWGRVANRSLHSLGAITNFPMPMGHLAAFSWITQFQIQHRDGRPRWDAWGRTLPFAIWRATVPRVSLVEARMGLTGQDALPGRIHRELYYQVNTNHPYWGAPLCSPSLSGRHFPYTGEFGAGRPLHWEADTFDLGDGHIVRRVRVKNSNIKIEFPRPPGFPGPGSPRSRPEPPPVFIVLQLAADHSRLDARIDSLRAEREAEVAAIHDETAAALSRLRNNLWAIGGSTFLAAVLGTYWLVWAGLLPLRKLGDAVSHVSPRDFSFPITAEEMPSELQPITERLAGTLDQLHRAFEREKQATADISHELRTPLAALMTTCELALRRERTPEKYREMFADCHASAKYLHQIVERLLSLARIDAGVDKCKPQPVDVARVADECATVIRPLAEAKGLTLAVHHGGSTPELDSPTRTATDPDKLREVMNNLLHNAIQYNRPDGRIDLTVSRENGHVRFEVADTGVGIPEASRERIFERFYRADPSRNCGDGLHAGLGLAIVREYIEVMGGRIEVQSREGEGTTFRIDLPVRA
jgi:heavy metal sensor kinase